MVSEGINRGVALYEVQVQKGFSLMRNYRVVELPVPTSGDVSAMWFATWILWRLGRQVLARVRRRIVTRGKALLELWPLSGSKQATERHRH